MRECDWARRARIRQDCILEVKDSNSLSATNEIRKIRKGSAAFVFYIHFPMNPHFEVLDGLKSTLDQHRSLDAAIVENLREDLIVRWTYHLNAIEGNALTLRETKVALEGIIEPHDDFPSFHAPVLPGTGGCVASGCGGCFTYVFRDRDFGGGAGDWL